MYWICTMKFKQRIRHTVKSQLPALAQTNIITCKIDIIDNMSDLSGFHSCRVEWSITWPYIISEKRKPWWSLLFSTRKLAENKVNRDKNIAPKVCKSGNFKEFHDRAYFLRKCTVTQSVQVFLSKIKAMKYYILMIE